MPKQPILFERRKTITTNNKVDNSHTANSGSDTVETKDKKDSFLLATISNFKKSATVVEQGVLLFIALLTNPEGPKVEVLKPTAEGQNGRMKLQGLGIKGFINFYDWKVDDTALYRGLKIAAVLNGTENRLMDIKLPKGKSWREGSDLQRLNYVREELDGINPKELSAYFQNLFNVVAQGKAIPKAAAGVSGNAAATAAAAIEVAEEKATSRTEAAAAKRTVVEKLNGKSRETQSNSEQQPTAADVVPRLKKVLGVMTQPDFDRGLLFSDLVAVFSTNQEEFAAFAEFIDIGQEALATAAELLAGNQERISTTV